MSVSLGELATQFGCELIGDPNTTVSRLASLDTADTASLTFLSNPTYKRQLADTSAAAVILRESDASECPVAALVVDDPYAMYARMAAVVMPKPNAVAGVHATATIAATAKVDPTAEICANVVVGEFSTIAASVVVGAGSIIGDNCSLGKDSRLLPNVTLVRDVQIGIRCTLHPGVVIGADGFGNAMTSDGWIKVPQVGGVRIGDDVEIGANTTVDCGAIGDTVLGNGVRIDNLCMIAHNVHIGDHTALAAMTGIAGSTTIGKRCLFAGRSGAVGHLSICDDVVVAATTFVSKDIHEPGTYSSAFPADKAQSWAKQIARFRRLGVLMDRVKKLEK